MDKRTGTSGEYMPWFGLGWERALISVTNFGGTVIYKTMKHSETSLS